MINRDRFQEFIDKAAEKTRFSENTYLIFLSFVVGVSTGLGAVAFRWLILSFSDLFFGHGIAWMIPLIPMAGGLLVGPIVFFYAAEAKGHGVPEVMAAVALKSGVIRPRVAVAKAVASAICIGSGGSAGREGPIVQIGAAVGSTIGQIFRLSGDRVKILVGCGAAAGISAVFNAPIAGVIFALEVILGDFTIKTFSPVILSSVLASVVSRAILHDTPAFIVPPYELVSAWEIPLYILLGGFAGIVAVIFTRTLYVTEDFFDHKIKIPGYLKPALGGLLLGFAGLLAINLNYAGFHHLSAPAIFSDGYEAISSVLGGEGLWYTMLALVALKILATNLTLGSGNSGGIFAPSLFMGAMAGHGSHGGRIFRLYRSFVVSYGNRSSGRLRAGGHGGCCGGHHPCHHHLDPHSLRDDQGLQDYAGVDDSLRFFHFDRPAVDELVDIFVEIDKARDNPE
jgi:CIC family chloride channel protein